ncbi:MAG TPA: phosphoglycerate kinase [Candidatus Baltobacteraceae bacterium]|nr:phosphoglycerate kinase [Candidatus Baltobacteraceae bacterium]
MLFPFRTLKELDVKGKRVLVREDLNVPMKEGDVLDYKRINASLETLRYLSDHGAKVIVCSHLGRPDGKPDAKYSLKPVANALASRLHIDVTFASDTVGPAAHEAVNAMHDGEVVMLENVRFDPGEEQNDPVFARKLADLADAYVNDAFGTAHRAHASTEGVAHYLPSAAGFLMQAEIAALTKLIHDPEQPYVCVIGGAKVKDKVGVFTKLMEKVHAFCIGGGMANTFLAAKGVGVGKSLRDDDLEPAKAIIEFARTRDVSLLLPVDAVVSTSFDNDEGAHVVDLPQVADQMILDIGPKTAKEYAKVIETAKTVVFNGPMGVYEKAPYREGTRAVGEAMHKATQSGATTVVGGGDAAAAAEELKFAEYVSHVSTGGGATLEFLEGKELPGIKALEEAKGRVREDQRW